MGLLRTVYNVTSNKSLADDDDDDNSSGEGRSSRVVHGIPTLNGAPHENGIPHDAEVVDLDTPRGPPAWTSPGWRYVPRPLQRVSQAVITWTKGPVPPRPWRITPFFPAVQTFPIRALDHWFPKKWHKLCVLFGFLFCWLFCFSTMLHYSAFTDDVPGYGAPAPITCTATFWGAKNSCGIDGNSCRPFNESNLAFRCPASCLKTLVLNPRAVGTQEVNYKPLVVGGPTDVGNSVETAFYRGDSFICASAVHAGFITDAKGGCGVVEVVGESIDYPSIKRNGVSSTGFDSNFPLTFKFVPGTKSNCKDLRWPMLAVDVTFSAILAVFTYSSALFFTTIFPALFFHVALVSDPPDGASYYQLISVAVGGFLPAAFIAYVLYRFAIRKTLHNLRAQFEKAVLWLGPCWVGCLNNYTFDKIPIQRLTPRDIKQQPGGIVALIIIVLIIFVIALGQAWAIRVQGLMPRYLAVYGLMGFTLIMFVAIPHIDLRIHHYILAMLLIPGTFLQTRPSLVYQGLLVGFFINGIARWGFAPILETPGSIRADGQFGNDLPSIGVPVVNAASTNITFDWGLLPDGYDTLSVLVNDVERYRSYDNETTGFTWVKNVTDHPEYFRFGYMAGDTTYDYTQAGVWQANGSWTPAKPGPS